ncbi:MAG: NAD(P)-binding domain-containing protein [Verrucomicrobiota bacterium]|jgi:2-hydroxy-3-oxopropionate reductase
MKPKIGFIGLGIMGRHMGGNLLHAGYSLTVFDVVAAAMEPLVKGGAAPAKSCAEVARASDVVITMVTSSEAAEEAALGSHGVIAGAHQGLVFIDMSSSAPATAIKIATQLAKVGVGCLDAPVSGGELGAQQATLSIMVGGPEEVLNQVRPVFQAMGKTITLCGPHGAGQIVKACNQIQVALNYVGLAEALVLGAKAGVDPAVILKVLSGGYAQTRVMDVRGPKIIAGDFEPGGRVTVQYKDLGIALETADKLNVPLPGTALARQLYSALLAAGRGGLDHSAVITILEDLAGVKARTKIPSSH